MHQSICIINLQESHPTSIRQPILPSLLVPYRRVKRDFSLLRPQGSHANADEARRADAAEAPHVAGAAIRAAAKAQRGPEEARDERAEGAAEDRHGHAHQATRQQSIEKHRDASSQDEAQAQARNILFFTSSNNTLNRPKL